MPGVDPAQAIGEVGDRVMSGQTRRGDQHGIDGDRIGVQLRLGEEEIFKAKLDGTEARLDSVVAERDAPVRQKDGSAPPSVLSCN